MTKTPAEAKKHYLSKSDFKTAKECLTKLYYKKLKYPNLKDGNEYQQMLAEGGHVIGKMAQLLYPDGILVQSRDPGKAFKETLDLMAQENVTIFEATFISKQKLARTDILIKRGQQLQIIEVKAKSYEGSLGIEQFWTKRQDKIKAEWMTYFEDLAFQNVVLKGALAKQFDEAFKIKNYLLMPDKNCICQTDGLAKLFSIRREEADLASSSDSRQNNILVDFNGDYQEIQKEQFLSLLSVDKEVDFVLQEIQASSDEILKSLKPKLIKVQEPINKKCRNCEYRIKPSIEPNGFLECWGHLAENDNHILDLYFGGGNSIGEVSDELISQGKVSLADIPFEALEGTRGTRQRIQIEHTLKNTEWQEATLKEILQGLEYPLHFIDFETYQSAIPYHKGMKPYEKVAFQWSCHTLESPDAEPIHSEYLNLENLFPNFEFAEKLMESIGSKGTILVWSQYENSILRDIYNQMEVYGTYLGYKNPQLRDWIANTASLIKGEKPTRMVDLNELCIKYYFHPAMKGKTSIKYVLPAVWNSNLELHTIPWLQKYYSNNNGEIVNPYAKLEDIEIAGKAESVREGTGAMRAYEEMVYGNSSLNPERRNKWAELLKEYCKLDTLAMVIIWLHWRTNQNESREELTSH